MLDFTKTIEELKKDTKDNEVILKGVGEDVGVTYYIDDDTASQIKAILDKASAAHLWVCGDGRKTAKKMADKVISKDGVFEYRPVTTTLNTTAYQIRIVPTVSGEELDGTYASEMTKKVRGTAGVVDFSYIATNGKTYRGRGVTDEKTAKKIVDALNKSIGK